MKIDNLEIINIEWNNLNGLQLSILRINHRALFGFCFGWKSYLQIDILYLVHWLKYSKYSFDDEF